MNNEFADIVLRDRSVKKIILNNLLGVLGTHGISTDPEDLLCASYDGTRQKAMPEVLCKPVDADEVAGVMKIASEHSIPVYPRGARTGLTGGSLATDGGIALDLMRMDRILDVSNATRTATAQPGVLLGDFQRACEEQGLFYPPDPASAEFASLGGTLAECAGGMRCVKYGVTRDYVLSVEAVLASGEIIRLGSRAYKNVVGYDLLRLLVGSEGTLAVITEATLKLLPLPESVQTTLAAFEKVADAVTAVESIFRAGLLPRMIELMDSATVAAVREYVDVKLPTKAGALLLIEVDGSAPATADEAKRVKQELKNAGAILIKEAAGPAERAKLHEVRRSTSPALFNIASGKLNEDVSVPLDKLIDVFNKAEELGEKYGIAVPCFAHAGDGNVHVNFMYDADNDKEFRKAEKAAGELFEKVVRLGGSLSGEHGIGTTKQKFLGLELDEPVIDLMKKVKEVFDPTGILNPGKIFPK